MRRKAVAGPIAHVRSGYSAAGSRLLFIHPGGLPAIFAYADKLGSWLSKTPARPSGSGAGSRIAPDGVRGRPARGLGLVEDPFCIGETARPATGPAWIGPSGQTSTNSRRPILDQAHRYTIMGVGRRPSRGDSHPACGRHARSAGVDAGRMVVSRYLCKRG